MTYHHSNVEKETISASVSSKDDANGKKSGTAIKEAMRLAFKFSLTAAFFTFALTALFHGSAIAQSVNIDIGEGGSVSGRLIQIVAMMTVLSLAPSIMIMVTSFTRLVIVLSLLRTALGTQGTPPNTVLTSLALFMTLFIMQPTLEEAYNNGIAPLIEEQITEEIAFERTTAPFHAFMRRHVREADLQLFMDVGDFDAVENPTEIPLRALIPAFMISELKRAFEIGFLLFVPFLVIDMVVASVLMSMGMMMLPPIMISMPFKLIFFVLVDGWYLVVGSLIQSFVS